MRVFRPVAMMGVVLALVFASPAQPQNNPPSDPLSQAHAMHLRLLRIPVAERSPADYERIIAVLAPLAAQPREPNADSARYEIASLYVAEARDLHLSSAYRKAAQVLLDLLHQLPYTEYRRNAEFALAQIQRFHEQQAGAANYWLRDFERRYPADPRVPIARDELRGRRIAEPAYLEPAALPTVPLSTPPAVTRPALPPSPPPAALPRTRPQPSGSRRLTVHLGNVQTIEVFSNGEDSSVVIALHGRPAFHRGAIPSRHLVYFDISAHGAPSAAAGSPKTLRVDDGRVRTIRVATFRPGVTRVVIETEAGERTDAGRIFPNPERLILAVSGADRARSSVHPPAPRTPAAPPLAPQRLPNGRDSLTRALGLKIHTIVLDPGHGGHDTGTIGPGGIEEKDVALDVALRLGKLLQSQLGVHVVYTRKTDRFIPLQERTAIANRAKADLFVSIHLNASRDHAARGIETYFLNFTSDAGSMAVAARENAGSNESIHNLTELVHNIATNDKTEESQMLARDLDSSLVAASHEPNRGVKSAPFVVLIGANMPSVLAEISFLSNPADVRRLRQAAYRQRLAEALLQGIRKYISSLGGFQPAAATS